MQPWKISAGLTAALAGLTVLLAGSRLEYLAPFWSVILADHGVPIASHLALALAAVLAALYAIARAAGLADLGRHGSISPSAPSGAARAIPNSPAPSRGMPRATGSDWWDNCPVPHARGPSTLRPASPCGSRPRAR